MSFGFGSVFQSTRRILHTLLGVAVLLTLRSLYFFAGVNLTDTFSGVWECLVPFDCHLASAPKLHPLTSFSWYPSVADERTIIGKQRISCLPNQNQMETVLSCLRLTHPSLANLEYPPDANAHLDSIHEALRPWGRARVHCYAGYCGPWVENMWISHFGTIANVTLGTRVAKDENSTSAPASAASSACLSDAFGPFIPIFFPWVDLWQQPRAKKQDYPKMIDALKLVLRPDVPYVTVSQNDVGIAWGLMDAFPNLLVLSAGGYGHVPIPLLKQEEERNNHIPMKNRTRLVTYVGSLSKAPRSMRKLMSEELERELGQDYAYYYGDAWRSIMADSCLNLAPRGYGRTTFHLFETLQMGLIPIHVYTDVPWVPYANLMQNISFSTDMENLPSLVKELRTMTHHDLEGMEKKILSIRNSHLTGRGAMHQIGLFLKGSVSDLNCQKVPDSIRDAEPRK